MEGTMRKSATLEDVWVLAYIAHAGQTDKIGEPYFGHVEAVAKSLAPFGVRMQMAGYLHDVIEDADGWRAKDLREAGIPDDVVALVEAVTNEPGISYEKKMAQITRRGRDAVLLKIADNAHNSRADRMARLSDKDRERLSQKYESARGILWEDTSVDDIAAILSIVNPDLLKELERRVCGWWR
jgi:(p)ppGpp synthase/HD superfamily hydrolase